MSKLTPYVALFLGVLSSSASLPAEVPAEQNSAPFYPGKMNLLVWRDPQGVEHPVTNPQDWERRREHILANMQLVMGPLPAPDRRVPLDAQVVQTETLPTLTRKKITYESSRHRRPLRLKTSPVQLRRSWWPL